MFSCGPDADSFSYPDFSSTVGLTAAGDATLVGSIYHLITPGLSKTGAVWTTEKKAVVRGFAVTFTARGLTATDPTDGFSFVVQNDSATPPLQEGGFMGYSSINNCLAVEFDGISNPHTNDPTFDHVAVMHGAPGDNAIHDAAHELSRSSIAELDNTTVMVQIVYDAAARTFSAPGIFLTDFDIEDYVTLDDGRAWMGIVATSGTNNFSGPTELHNWSLDIPTACGEDVFWEKPFVEWNIFGYNGDTYDHRLTGDFLQAGDIINEELVYVSDDLGLDPDDDIQEIIDGAVGKWKVVSDTRHGIQGLWRGRFDANQEDGEFDSHGIDINRLNIQAYFEAGAVVGTAVFGQIMKLDGTEIEVGRHRITYRFIKISPETTQGGSDCYDLLQKIHQITRKDNAFNVAIWPFADTMPPLLPCPPP